MVKLIYFLNAKYFISNITYKGYQNVLSLTLKGHLYNYNFYVF